MNNTDPTKDRMFILNCLRDKDKYSEGNIITNNSNRYNINLWRITKSNKMGVTIGARTAYNSGKNEYNFGF